MASGCCYAALGSDTGGSVRLPAAYCGVVGYKPSYGRSSRHGLISFASSFDCPGVLANTVKDAAIIANAISGADPMDSTCPLEPTTFVPTPGESAPLYGAVIGIPEEYYVEELSADGLAAWERGIAWAEAQGATVKSVSLPLTTKALPAYYILALAEASSNLARYDGMEFGQ